jgi:hypothetical protein
MLKEMGSKLPLATAQRWLASLNNIEKPITFREMQAYARELQGRLSDELSETKLWVVPDERNRFLVKRQFGEAVEKNFNPATKDIREAGRCLALGRGTACVFHLMRVMEVGLRALGTSLNDERLDPKKNPTWDTILKRGDAELKLPLKERSGEWRTDEHFFSTAHANLRAVKDAWRNPTMHVEQHYDPEDAEEVWNTVKGFMRHLSKKLTA